MTIKYTFLRQMYSLFNSQELFIEREKDIKL